jgi:maltooligosyltrehalose synthase
MGIESFDPVCAGTTGYDTLHPVAGLFADPAGDAPLTSLYVELTDEPARALDLDPSQ